MFAQSPRWAPIFNWPMKYIKDLTSRETISLRPKGGYGGCVSGPGHLPDCGHKVGGDPKGSHTQVRQAEVQQDHVEVGS